jgi:hypothetical protein
MVRRKKEKKNSAVSSEFSIKLNCHKTQFGRLSFCYILIWLNKVATYVGNLKKNTGV